MFDEDLSNEELLDKLITEKVKIIIPSMEFACTVTGKLYGSDHPDFDFELFEQDKIEMSFNAVAVHQVNAEEKEILFFPVDL